MTIYRIRTSVKGRFETVNAKRAAEMLRALRAEDPKARLLVIPPTR